MFPANSSRHPAAMLALTCVCLTFGPRIGVVAAKSANSAACRPLVPQPGISEGRIAAKNITFHAEASERVVQGAEGCSWATMSSVAYSAELGEPSRPLTFVFNGG